MHIARRKHSRRTQSYLQSSERVPSVGVQVVHTTRAACVGTGVSGVVCAVWCACGLGMELLRGKGHLTKAKDYLTTHMSQAFWRARRPSRALGGSGASRYLAQTPRVTGRECSRASCHGAARRTGGGCACSGAIPPLTRAQAGSEFADPRAQSPTPSQSPKRAGQQHVCARVLVACAL